MKPRTVCTIEARMRSTRLPGKVLKTILGHPMLALQIERVRRAATLDDIVVATSDHESCDPIEALAGSVGVRCFRGSEDDVLDRVLRAAKSARADVIVELTGDCPLIDPAVVDRVVESFRDSPVDYCSNTLSRTYPAGMDTQVFPVSVLERVAALTADPADHEHVSLYIYRHPETFSLRNVTGDLPAGAEDLRLVVDTPADFALVSRIFERLYPRGAAFTIGDVIGLFARGGDGRWRWREGAGG